MPEQDYDLPLYQSPEGEFFSLTPEQATSFPNYKPLGFTYRDAISGGRQRITDEPSISKTAAQALLGLRQSYESAMPKIVGGGMEAIGGILPEDYGGKALRKIGREGREGANQIGQEYEELGKGVGGGMVGEFARSTASSVVPSVAAVAAAAPFAIAAGGGAAAAGASAAAMAARQALQAKIVGTASGIFAGLESLGGTYGDAFEAYKKQGLSDEEAYKKSYAPAIASGLVTGLITKGFGGTGLEKVLLTKTAPKGFGRGVFEAAKDAGFEFIEEGSDESWQSVIRNLSFNPEATSEENLRSILMAGAAGGLLGGFANAVKSAPSAISDAFSKQAPAATPPPLPPQVAPVAPAPPAAPAATRQTPSPIAPPVAPIQQAVPATPTPRPSAAPVQQPAPIAAPLQPAPPTAFPPIMATRKDVGNIASDQSVSLNPSEPLPPNEARMVSAGAKILAKQGFDPETAAEFAEHFVRGLRGEPASMEVFRTELVNSASQSGLVNPNTAKVKNTSVEGLVGSGVPRERAEQVAKENALFNEARARQVTLSNREVLKRIPRVYPVKKAVSAPPTTPASETPTPAAPKPRRVAITPEAQAAAPKRQQALPESASLPEPLEGQPYDTRLENRPEAAMETRPAATLGIERGRVSPVDPDLAAAVEDVRGGYAERTARELEAREFGFDYDVNWLESLAKKYGAPVSPVSKDSSPSSLAMRASNMLQRAADKSSDAAELERIIVASNSVPEGSRILWAVANNPNSSSGAFATVTRGLSKAAIDRLVARREELRSQRGLDATTPPAATPPAVAARPQVRTLLKREQKILDTIRAGLKASGQRDSDVGVIQELRQLATIHRNYERQANDTAEHYAKPGPLQSESQVANQRRAAAEYAKDALKYEAIITKLETPTTQPSNAPQEQAPVEVLRNQPPGTPAQVAEGRPSEVSQSGGEKRDKSKPEQMTPEEFKREIKSRKDGGWYDGTVFGQRIIGGAEAYTNPVTGAPSVATIGAVRFRKKEQLVAAALGMHGRAIAFQAKSNLPLSAAAVDTYGIKLPEGYIREGDLYVYRPAAQAQPEQARVAPPGGQAPLGTNLPTAGTSNENYRWQTDPGERVQGSQEDNLRAKYTDAIRASESAGSRQDFLRGTDAQIEAVITGANVPAVVRQGVGYEGRPAGAVRGLRSGTESQAGKAVPKVRVFISTDALDSTARKNAEILASRIFPTESGAQASALSDIYGGDFVLTAARRTPFFVTIFSAEGSEAPLARTETLADGTPAIIFNTTNLGKFNLQDAATAAQFDGVLSEELIHVAAVSVTSQKEAQDVWASLSDKEKKATERSYNRRKNLKNLTPTTLGHEYLRMVIQERMFGKTTEQVALRITEPVKKFLRKLLNFIKEAFGKKPENDIARQLVSRIEGAIRGDAPIQGPITGGSAMLSLGSTPTATPAASLSKMQVEQAVRELFDGDTPPNFQVTHNYGKTFKAKFPLGTFDGVSLSSRSSQAPTSGESVVVVLKDGTKVGTYDPNTGELSFTASAPAAGADLFFQQARTVRGWYDPDTGTIWLNAAYLRSPQEARAVFVEEAFHAIQNDKAVQKELSRLVASLTPEQLSTARAAYGNISEEQLQMEAVADILEKQQLTQEQRGILARMWDAVLGAVQRLYGKFTGKVFTERDAQDILAKALKAAAEGKRTNVGGQTIFAANAVVVPPNKRDKAFSLTAHHGTPHTVDKFTTSKIGTGEGAQAYGWGLYFAENELVARDYKKNLSGEVRFDGQDFNRKDARHKASNLLFVASERFGDGARLQAIAEADERSQANTDDLDFLEESRAIASILRAGTEAKRTVSSGRLYTVTLNVKPEELLDWDKPLSEQSENVRKALQSAGISLELSKLEAGESLYRQVKSYVFSNSTKPITGNAEQEAQREASEYLSGFGIKGIRYLDQGSRGSKAGTYNYVIFNEEDIKITHTNGQPVTVKEAQAEQALSVGSPQNRLDKTYFEAIQRGDLKEAQRLVDEAAKEAGYDTAPYLHHTFKDFTVFKPGGGKVPFGPESWSGNAIWLESEKSAKARPLEDDLPPIMHNVRLEAAKRGLKTKAEVRAAMRTMRLYAKPLFPLGGTDAQWRESLIPEYGFGKEFPRLVKDSDIETLRRIGRDSAYIVDRRGDISELVLLDPSQVKSADPITYDDSGSIIPLSQRFQQESPDIRYSLGGPVKGIANETTRTIRGDDSKGVAHPFNTDQKRVDANLTGSQEVLWRTTGEIERIFSGRDKDSSGISKSSEAGPAPGERVDGNLYPGSPNTAAGVFEKARVIIESSNSESGVDVQGGTRILANRILFGTNRPAQEDGNLRLARRLADLKFVFVRLKPTDYMAFYSRDSGVIVINSTIADTHDFTQPQTQEAWDAILLHELIHATADRLSSNAEMASVWRSLTTGEQIAVRRAYDFKGRLGSLSEDVMGHEYVRMMLEDILTGKTTEGFESGYGKQFIAILKKLLAVLREAFGKKPTNDIARQVIERIEGAIRGDAPIKQPLFPNSGEILATNISQSDATEVQGRAIEPSIIAAAGRAVADLGRQSVEAFEQAGRQLEGLAYENKQFRKARSELNRLVKDHDGLLQQRYPDRADLRTSILEGVSVENGQIIVSDALVTKLAQMGVKFRPELVRAMQAEIFFEQQARRLADTQEKRNGLIELRDYYILAKAPDAEIVKLSKMIAAKQKVISAISPVTTQRDASAQSVAERASEIKQAEASKVELQSKRDALNLEPVQEFFGKGITELRDLSEKAKAAADLTRALMDGATSISEMARLGEIYDKWSGFDATVKNALQKGTLTEEQRTAVLTDLQKSFDEFDAAKFRMDDLIKSEEKGLLKDIRASELEIADAKVNSGMADILVADALKAAKGEMGLTGTVGDAANIANLEKSTSMISTLAESLGKTLDQNRWLYDFLMAPGDMPAFGASVAASLNISEDALREVLRVVQKSPALASAIVTIADHAASKWANSPPVQMESIAKLATSGNPLGMVMAASLTSKIVQQANSQGTAAKAVQKAAASKLAQSVLRLRTLQQGQALFNQTASSPAFQQLRGTVSSGASGAQEMVVLGPTGPVLRGFKSAAKEYQPELKINVESNAPELELTRKKVWQYVQNAERYVADYERAEMEHQMDPSKPTPQQLGFDRADYNGLKFALNVQIWPMFLDLGDLDTEAQYVAPALMRKLMKWPGTGAIFGQYEQIGKMVGGMAGGIFRQQVARYKRGYLDAKRVSSQFQNLPKLQSEAMRSHGIKAEETYRAIFNEMAGYGRLYGSPLRVGFKLPISQQVVTKEDMAFFNRTLDFFEKLRREVTEIDPVTGVRYMRGDKEITRKGAYTGDKSMARHLNRNATQFIADVTDAYRDTPQGFTSTTDLSASSKDKVAAYWNKHLDTIKRHILDSPRTDRSFKQTAEMAAAEKRIAARWLAGNMDPISSVQDLADLIAAELQPTTGKNPADVAVQGLNNELLQYVVHAERIQKERAADNAKNSGASIALSSDNEFTKPAAYLELPSEYYDYGAVSSIDRITALSRANHTVLVDFANSLRLAVKELESRLSRMEKATGKELELLGKDYGGNRQEMKDMLQLLKDSLKKFEDTYRAGGPDILPTKLARKLWDTVVGNLLAKIPTGLRNISQGQFQVFAVAAQMHYMSRKLAMWKALSNIPRGYLNTSYLVARNISGFIDRRLGLDKQAQRTIQKLVDVIADEMVFKPAQLVMGKPRVGAQNVRDSFKRVRDDLGFDTSQDWTEVADQAWSDAGQFQTAKDQQEAEKNAISRAIHFADRLANTGADTVNAFVRGSVLESGDTVMNALSLGLAGNLEQRLQEVAMVFGERLTKEGIARIDPTDKRSMLQPQEWLPSSNVQDGRNSLGEIRRFLESSASAEGFQLEKNLLQYYQAKVAGKPAKIFGPRTYDAVQRNMIAENNASLPTNRASSGQAYPIWRSLLALTGYPADATLKMLRIMIGGSRDRSAVLQALHKLPLYVGIAAMAIITQGASEAAGELYRRRIQGQRSGRVTPLDADFWTDPQHMTAALRRYFTASSYLVGDLISGITGWAEGRKTIDPAQKALLFSTASAVLREIASGVKIVKDTGDLSKALIPIRNLTLRMSFGGEELSRMLGINISSVNDAKKAISENAKVQGFEVPPAGAFGPAGYSSVQRRTIGEDVSRMEQAQRDGDTEGYAKAKASAQKNIAELEQFYLKKRLEAGDSPEVAARTAKTSVWADYQEINPVTAALGGKRPSAEQYKQLVESSTGERGAVIRQGIKAWQDGAQALFGKPGNITKEDVAENRPGGTVREPSYGRVSLTGGVSGRMVSVGSRSSGRRRAKIRRVSLTGRRRRISPMKGRRKKLRRVRLTA